MICDVTAGMCDVTLLCNMLHNNPHAQLLLSAGCRQPAADSTATARHGGCQFAGIRLLHLPLDLLLCATRQPFSLLHALGGATQRQARGGLSRVANHPAVARVQRWRKGCMAADSHSHPKLSFLVAAAALRRRRSAGSDVNLVGRRLHKQGKLVSISELQSMK